MIVQLPETLFDEICSAHSYSRALVSGLLRPEADGYAYRGLAHTRLSHDVDVWRVVLEFVPRDSFLVIRAKAVLFPAQGLDFHIREADGFKSVAAAFGLIHDKQVNARAFDDRFLVETRNVQALRGVFRDSRLHELGELPGRIQAELTGATSSVKRRAGRRLKGLQELTLRWQGPPDQAQKAWAVCDGVLRSTLIALAGRNEQVLGEAYFDKRLECVAEHSEVPALPALSWWDPVERIVSVTEHLGRDNSEAKTVDALLRIAGGRDSTSATRAVAILSTTGSLRALGGLLSVLAYHWVRPSSFRDRLHEAIDRLDTVGVLGLLTEVLEGGQELDVIPQEFHDFVAEFCVRLVGRWGQALAVPVPTLLRAAVVLGTLKTPGALQTVERLAVELSQTRVNTLALVDLADCLLRLERVATPRTPSSRRVVPHGTVRMHRRLATALLSERWPVLLKAAGFSLVDETNPLSAGDKLVTVGVQEFRLLAEVIFQPRDDRLIHGRLDVRCRTLLQREPPQEFSYAGLPDRLPKLTRSVPWRLAAAAEEVESLKVTREVLERAGIGRLSLTPLAFRVWGLAPDGANPVPRRFTEVGAQFSGDITMLNSVEVGLACCESLAVETLRREEDVQYLADILNRSPAHDGRARGELWWNRNRVRLRAIVALGEKQDAGAVGVLAEALKSKEREVSLAAVRALTSRSDTQAVADTIVRAIGLRWTRPYSDFDAEVDAYLTQHEAGLVSAITQGLDGDPRALVEHRDRRDVIHGPLAMLAEHCFVDGDHETLTRVIECMGVLRDVSGLPLMQRAFGVLEGDHMRRMLLVRDALVALESLPRVSEQSGTLDTLPRSANAQIQSRDLPQPASEPDEE